MKFKEYYTYLTEEKFDQWEDLKDKYSDLKNAVEVMTKIHSHGFECLIVGGATRDLLLGKDPHDIDLVSNANTEQIEKIFGTSIDIGKNKLMGVTVVPYKGQNIEIATYRKDIYDKLGGGKGADKVEITSSFKDDAERRDYKLNALGIDKDGNVIDHVNGLSDIKNKIISFVGDPKTRIIEDPVRLMRGVRFSSKLGFRIDDKTMEAIKQHAPEIKKVAAERISQELFKMADAEGETFAKSIQLLINTGLMQYILPEIVGLADKLHSLEDHPEGEGKLKGTVLGHVIEAIKTVKIKDPLVTLAVLLHDIGKLKTHSVGDDNKHHYYGHEAKAFEMIDEIANRLRLDNDTREALQFAAANHMKMPQFLKLKDSTALKMMNSPYFDLLLSVAEADSRARGQLFDEEEWNKIIQKIEKLKSKYSGSNSVENIRKIINGKFIIDLLKINPKTEGKKIGEIIKKTMDWILDKNINVNDIDKIKNFILGMK